ncbi:MAG: hypothetical protein P1U72_06240 [Paracoccaceae bacterium]|nr:hypothetical protein [Paracoccaceae bacterium]
MFGSTLIAIIVFGAMFTVAVLGFIKSNATADRYSRNTHRDTQPSGTVATPPQAAGRF